jgi:hypothetical protein
MDRAENMIEVGDMDMIEDTTEVMTEDMMNVHKGNQGGND